MDYAGCSPLAWFLGKNINYWENCKAPNLTKLVEVGHLLSDGEGPCHLHTYYHPDLITRSIPVIKQPICLFSVLPKKVARGCGHPPATLVNAWS